MCKVGGQILYSTCSINPLEDEAVITELFRKVGPDAIELIDIHTIYDGLKSRRGLTNWKVLCSKFKDEIPELYEESLQLKLEDLFYEYQKGGEEHLKDQIQERINHYSKLSLENRENPELKGKYEKAEKFYRHFMKRLRPSMLPLSEEIMSKVIKIQNCMRLLPHDNDSGGFFVVLIQKKASHHWLKSTEGEKLLEAKLQ